MKRFGKLILLLMLFVLTGTWSVWGANAATLFVKTEGPDCYGNGDPADVGAIYAAVWVKDGATFHFQADGTWDRVEGCHLLGMVRTDFAGMCAYNRNDKQRQFQLQIDTYEMENYKGGRFELHLLDTRNLDKSASPVSGTATTPEPTLINVATKVASVSVAEAISGSSDIFMLLEKPVDDISLVPDEAPQPVISSCRLVTEGKASFFELKIKKTVRYLNYNLARGDALPVDDRTNVALTPVNGSPTSNLDEERTIRIPLAGNEKCGFFRVIRHQPIPVEQMGERQ